MTTSPSEPHPPPSPAFSIGERALLLHQLEPRSPFKPDEELHFDFPSVPPSPQATSPQEYSYSNPPRAPVRKMISVPELRDGPGLPAKPVMYRQNSAGGPSSRLRQSSEDRGREMEVLPELLSKQVHRRMLEQEQSGTRVPHETATGGRDRLLRQKSIERGIILGLPPGHSPQGRRAVNGQSRRGRRNGERTESPTPPPGLKMPLAFNSIVPRERGFTTGSPHPSPQALPPLANLPRHGQSPRGGYSPSGGPSNSAPDLFANSDNRNHPHARNDLRTLPRSHYTPPQPPYSNNTSANTSPHSSFGLSATDEVRTSFRSALSAAEENRSSTFTSSSELTEDSHAMTVDEAIGMYGSDSDEEILQQPTPEEEHRRSKGDSVLGGATSTRASLSEEELAEVRRGDSTFGGVSRQASFAELEWLRSKGDSVLGGYMSPATRSKMAEPEQALQRVLDVERQERQQGVVEKEQDQEVEKNTTHVEAKTDDQTAGEGENEAPRDEDPVEPDGPGALEDRVDLNANEGIDSPSEPTPTKPTPTDEALRKLESNSLPPKPNSPKLGSRPEPDEPDTPPRNPPPVNGVAPKDARDRYGFRKQTQYVTLQEYDEWNSRYEETLRRRRGKWELLLRESGLSPSSEGGPVRFPPKSTKVKRYVRKGIPPEWRGAAWFWYAGGQKMLNKHPGLYEELVKKGSTTTSTDSELIERDLHRTFPDNIKFKPDPPPGSKRLSKLQQQQSETPTVQQLRRVLVAFSLHVPKIGYCQSLNFLAGLLLLFMTEERAFWMLYILTHTHLPGTHEVNLEGSSVDQWVLMMSVRESLPGIWAKIGGDLDGSDFDPDSARLPPVTLCTSSWFMSGFIGSLPIESVLRVWDCLFYEGSKTLFRIALTVFKTGEPQIRAVNDPMEIFQVVQTIPRRLVDAGAIIEACYRRRNGFGHISQETIDQRRQERRDVFAAERAAIARGGVRASRDDQALRNHFGGPLQLHGHHDFSRKFKKILVKT